MLGVCYYPEHWPPSKWPEDAARMRDLGLTYVRVGEFAWSRIEPASGQLEWTWLDEALAVLGSHDLRVVLGTPTATPPRWLMQRSPEIHPVGPDGRPRAFGSRRHYCFSSPIYREESRRIVTLMAERYGRHAAVAGWQTDNEYGCHDTVRCCCERCRVGFQHWLAARYGDVKVLNEAWGTVFWSQEYGEFAAIDLPVGCVTEPNPSHLLDYWRYASHTVTEYNAMQVSILRSLSPDRFVTHNFMGLFTDLDAFEVSCDLDFASHDSYPLGFTEQFLGRDEALAVRYARTAHPDMAPFHHDWYRGAGRGRFWVMEQQPGPVNWAPWNPSPAPGMVRLWTHEALAHGAEVVSYFRWRQAPFAQEQMHAGLLTPDSCPDVGFDEASQVARELAELAALLPAAGECNRSPIAFVFDVASDWIYRIQPQGRDFSYLSLAFTWYTALRRLGLDVDFVRPTDSVRGYRLVVAPSVAVVDPDVARAWKATGATIVVGPRTASKTPSFTVPDDLPPHRLLPIQVRRVESLRPGLNETIDWNGGQYPVTTWVESVASDLEPSARFADGRGALYTHEGLCYLAFWPGLEFLMDFFAHLCAEREIATVRLHEDLRLRRRGAITFAFSYASHALKVPVPDGARFVMGGPVLPPRGVAAWIDEKGR